MTIMRMILIIIYQMTWLLTYQKNLSENMMCSLDLTHRKRGSSLRQWHGPIAQKLFQLCLKNHAPIQHPNNQSAIILNKQNAQSFLIESCLYQQNLFQQFFVTQDLAEKQVKPHAGIGDMLLFIRMNHIHLSQDTLDAYINLNMTCYADQSSSLAILLNHKLIQKIHCFGQNFYDKNPFPHHHIFDTHTRTLKDYDFADSTTANQQIILGHT